MCVRVLVSIPAGNLHARCVRFTHIRQSKRCRCCSVVHYLRIVFEEWKMHKFLSEFLSHSLLRIKHSIFITVKLMPSTETVTNFPFFRFHYYYYTFFLLVCSSQDKQQSENDVAVVDDSSDKTRNSKADNVIFFSFVRRFVSRTCNLNAIYTNTDDGIRGASSIGVHIRSLK